MKPIIIAILLILGISQAQAKDWTTGEKTLFTTYLALSAYDAAQSWNNWTPGSGFIEKNSLLKSREHMLAFKTLSGVGTYLLVDKLQPKQSYVLLTTLIIVQGLVVKRNDSIGMKVNINF